LRRDQPPFVETSEFNAESVGPLVRDGQFVRLRRHVPANRSAVQRWYGDPDIVPLFQHDPRPLSPEKSGRHFDANILPQSQRGVCYAIHEASTDRLIGTANLVDFRRPPTGARSALFRILIGEKDTWSRGYGTEATRLVVAEAFETHDLTEVRLKVFGHNPRAIKAYERVGFAIVSTHLDRVRWPRRELQIIEMRLRRLDSPELEIPGHRGDETATVATNE
jgi:RimJ/RimL family protein N-acetyltransferase